MDIKQSWATIESVLRAKFPAVAATLNPGTTHEKLAELEQLIGKSLPADFRASLLLHDGQTDSTRQCDLLNFNRLLTVDEMIQEWEMLTNLFSDFGEEDEPKPIRIKNQVWSSGWIKFTDADGSGFVVDLDPAEKGIAGQVFYRPNAEVQTQTWADSYAGFLSRLADILDHGEYELDQGCPYVDIPVG